MKAGGVRAPGRDGPTPTYLQDEGVWGEWSM